jgi:hypothetical protein
LPDPAWQSNFSDIFMLEVAPWLAQLGMNDSPAQSPLHTFEHLVLKSFISFEIFSVLS